MEESLNIELPAKYIAHLRLNRFNNIFFNMSIGLMSIMLIALFSSLIGPVIYFFFVVFLLMVMACMIIFTFGAIFAVPENPVSKIWSFFQVIINANDSVMKITQFCFNSTKWLSLAGVISSVIGIVLISVSKCGGKVGKIIALSFFILIFVAVFVFQVLTGGVQWQ